jgi:DNA modification methylase
MGDIILMLERRDSDIDATFVKSQIDDSTTVVSAQVPSYSPEFGMVREEWTGAHHQHGVDLARLDNDLRLRDVILVTIPEPTTSRLGLLHVWTSPKSTYDIDAVRIPWDDVGENLKKTGEFTKGWKPDSRNNSAGKNPTNFWFFSTLPANKKPIPTLFEVPPMIPRTLSSGIELDAIERIVLAHSKPDDSIYIWAADDDYDLLNEMATSLNRDTTRIPDGEREQFVPIPILRAELPFEKKGDFEDIEVTRYDSVDRTREIKVIAKIQDCRSGIREISGNRITHVVTSPPYNIGYEPFNDPRPNSSGELVAPVREGYEDDLAPEQYAALLQSTFEEIDSKTNPDAFELYLNIKSNYSGGCCDLPFYMLELMPERWELLDILVWRYDISFDPGRGKYKPQYEWVIRVGFGDVALPEFGMLDWYIPILKGNSIERKDLAHPAMFPRELVKLCLKESNRPADLVLDPFLGSGTTLAACLEIGVDGIGFEISPSFSPDISKRFEWIRWVGDGVLKRA